MAAEEVQAIDDSLFHIKQILQRREAKITKKVESDPKLSAQYQQQQQILQQQQMLQQQMLEQERKAQLNTQQQNPGGAGVPRDITTQSAPPNIAGSLNSTAVKRGDVWNHEGGMLPIGTEVVALTDAESNMWILAEVIGHRRSAGRPLIYEVADNDAGDDAGGPPRRKRYALSADRIIPLPTLVEFPLSRRAEFSAGQEVLALYPADGVTTFYKATVVKSAKKRRMNAYLLRFDDDNDEERDVDARFVVPLPPSFLLPQSM